MSTEFEGLRRVCKVFDKALIFGRGRVRLHSTPLECEHLQHIFL